MNKLLAPPTANELKLLDTPIAPKLQDAEEQKLQEQPSTLHDLLVSTGEGATFGFGGELLSGAQAVGSALSGESKSFQDVINKYETLKKKHEEEYKELEKRSPYASFLGNLGGSFLTGGAVAGLAGGAAEATGLTNLLKRLGAGEKMAQHIGVGTGLGALSAAGSSEGSLLSNPSEVAKDVLGGAAGGAVTGGVIGKFANVLENYQNRRMLDPSVLRDKAAQEIESGKRYGTPVDMDKLVDIDPNNPKSGVSIIKDRVNNVANKLADMVLNTRQEAKDALNQEFLNSGNILAGISSENQTKLENAALNGIFKDPTLSSMLENSDKELYKNINEIPKNYAEEINEILSTKDANGKQLYSLNDAVKVFLDEKKNGVKQLLADQYNLYNPDYSKVINILKSTFQEPDFLTLTNKNQFKLSQEAGEFLSSIDKNISNKVLSGEPITISDIYNLRKVLMTEGLDTAKNKNLSPAARGLIFGDMGEEPGIINRLTNVINDANENILNKSNDVKEHARALDTLLSKTPDTQLQQYKGIDLSSKELKPDVFKEISTLVKSAMGDNETAFNARTLLRDMLDQYKQTLKYRLDKNIISENDFTKESLELSNLSKHIDDVSSEYGAFVQRGGIDRFNENENAYQRLKKAFPTSKTSGELARKYGAMQAATKEEIENIPDWMKSPFRAAKTPIDIRNANIEDLKDYADILSQSKNPTKANFGKGMASTLREGGAGKAVFLNTAYQNPELRKALGLQLGKKEENE